MGDGQKENVCTNGSFVFLITILNFATTHITILKVCYVGKEFKLFLFVVFTSNESCEWFQDHSIQSLQVCLCVSISLWEIPGTSKKKAGIFYLGLQNKMIELEATIDKVSLKRRRENQREKQRKCRDRSRTLARMLLILTSFIHVTTIKKNKVHGRKVFVAKNQIAFFINSKLSSFGNYVLNRKVVMEKLMASCIIRLHILPYYLFPNEARAQHALVQGLKIELQEVNGM